MGGAVVAYRSRAGGSPASDRYAGADSFEETDSCEVYWLRRGRFLAGRARPSRPAPGATRGTSAAGGSSESVSPRPAASAASRWSRWPTICSISRSEPSTSRFWSGVPFGPALGSPGGGPPRRLGGGAGAGAGGCNFWYSSMTCCMYSPESASSGVAPAPASLDASAPILDGG